MLRSNPNKIHPGIEKSGRVSNANGDKKWIKIITPVIFSIRM
jgi:hypothetical protein